MSYNSFDRYGLMDGVFGTADGNYVVHTSNSNVCECARAMYAVNKMDSVCVCVYVVGLVMVVIL